MSAAESSNALAAARAGHDDVCPPAATEGGWRDAVRHFRNESSHTAILSGSVVMLLGSAVVSIFNFAYNVAIARLLGPAEFGHATAIVTLLMLISALTLSFQLVGAKCIAANSEPGAKVAVYHALRRRSWTIGVLLAAALAIASGGIARFLQLPSPWVVLLLAAGIIFYVPLGARRGALQGVCAFPRLTANYVIESSVKFGAAVALVLAGYGLYGAVGAISISVVVAYFFPSLVAMKAAEQPAQVPASFREGMQAIVFFVGQVVITNTDMVLVKHFRSADEAGVYAAVILVGRVLYFACWQIVSTMFPIAAGEGQQEDNTHVLAVPLLLVVGISLVFILTLTIFPELVVRIVFGPHGFEQAVPLMSLYACSTASYALAVVLMAYEMSRRIANTGWLQLVFSGALIAGISLFHSSLREVVVVQLSLMVLLLVVVSLPFFRRRSTISAAAEVPA